MLSKPVIYRRDIVSRESYPKEEMFRLVLSDEGMRLDIEQRLPGRGIYIKKDAETIRQLKKKRRAARYRIPDELIEKMESLLDSRD